MTKKLLQQVDEKKAILDRYRPLPPEVISNLRDYLLVEWTYNSNALEGNTLTLQETRVVLEGITIGGKTLREHLEVVNHREAILYIEEIVARKEALTEHLIKEIHYLVLKNIRDRDAGKYRHINVFISGSRHVPPMSSLVPAMMRELVEWARSPEALSLHPVERAALFHHRFVYIHPFVDGNGRTARLLMNLLLLQEGYPVAIIAQEQRSEYYTALEKASVEKDCSGIVLLVTRAVERSLDVYLRALGA